MITEENKLPEAILVIANPIPRTNNGGISPKLKWPFKFGRNAAIICSRDRISNYKNCFRKFVFFSYHAFFMEWIDLLKFILIEDIKNLILYLRIKQKNVYLINNTSFI